MLSCIHTHMHFRPYMMKPSRSFPAACHHYHHDAARFTLARSLFCYRERQSWHVLLLASYFYLAKSVSETHKLPLLIHQPTNRLGDGGGKGMDNNVETNFFSSIEKFRLSLWIKRVTGTVQVYELVFLFLFLFLLHLQTCTSRLPYIRISLERERAI